MKITYLLLLIVLSCQTATESKTKTPLKTKEENIREFEEEFGITKPNWHDYDLHYWMNDSLEGVYQYLGIRARSEDSIDYLLVTTNQLCDMNFKGTAGIYVGNNFQIKSESPVFENSIKYQERKKDILVQIQFSQDSSNATIEFDRNGYADECDPYPKLILERKAP
ncbi:MAG: hypothetical protein ACYC1Q_04690 [Bacteroidia bacterium]